MEKLPLYRYLKRNVREITAALAITAASAVLIAPSETYAQPPAEKPNPSPRPTPVLRFETPDSIRINQGSLVPIFVPMPEATPPEWTATATITFYCLRGNTRSETPTRDGVIATDPEVIPLGSKVNIEDLGNNFSAEDTGEGIKGWRIDLWKSSCEEAKQLGVKVKKVRVTRYGW